MIEKVWILQTPRKQKNKRRKKRRKMKREIMITSMEMVSKQRNVFLALCFALVGCLLLVSLKLFLTKERVVLVPGLSREAWVTSEGVSESYLEEVTAMYLPMLLDLDTKSIEWKRDRLVTYISNSDPRYLKELHEYFARVKEQYSNFSLSTHFALKKIESRPEQLAVRVHGFLVQHFGNRGSETKASSYLLTYEWKGGKLLIKEFKKLSKEEDHA